MIVETIVPARSTSVFVADVTAGETWSFHTAGTWTDAFIQAGPKGYQNKLCALFGLWPKAPGLRLFELVGMIEGQPQTEFGIGAGRVVKIPSTGRLVVFANDVHGFYWNNRGALHLTSEHLQAETAATAPAAPVARVKQSWKTLAPSIHARVVSWGSRGGPGAGHRPVQMQGGWLATLSWAWNLLVDTLARTQALLYVFAATLIVSLALGMLAQGRDLIAAIVESHVSEHALNWQAAALSLSVGFLGLQAWFWTRRIIETNYGLKRSHWGEARPFLTVAPRFVGAIPIVVMILTLVWAHFTGLSEDNRSDGGVTALFLLGLGALYSGFVLFRLDIADRLTDASLRWWGFLWPIGTLVAGLAALAWICVDPVSLSVVVGAPAVVFFATACTMPLMVVIAQLGQLARVPLLLCLVVWAVFCAQFNDAQHEIGRRAFTLGSATRVAPERPTTEDVFKTWLGSRPPVNGKPTPVIVVATEGGASRAGYWTAVALDALQKRTNQAFAQHVFAISSISGASVGAVGWSAALYEPQPSRLLLDFAGQDALSPALAEMLFPDLLQRYWFMPLLPDRAEGLERGWEDAWRSACQAQKCSNPERIANPFLNIWTDALKDPAHRWRPLVLVGGATEEDGRRVTTAPIQLPASVDSYDFYAASKRQIAASTAIHNGARFPWVSPAGLTTFGLGRGHVVDGGYFDASGVTTAEELITTLRASAHCTSQQPSGCPYTFHLVIIRYCDADAYCPADQGSDDAQHPPAVVQPPPPMKPNLVAPDMLAPLAGLAASRDGHQNHLLTTAALDPTIQRQTILLRGRVCEGLPLNWVLSSKARDYVDAEALRDRLVVEHTARGSIVNLAPTSQQINAVAKLVIGVDGKDLVASETEKHAFTCTKPGRSR